jgi:hypothetical protein
VNASYLPLKLRGELARRPDHHNTAAALLSASAFAQFVLLRFGLTPNDTILHDELDVSTRKSLYSESRIAAAGLYVQVDYSALPRFSSSIEKTAWNQLLRRGAAMWAAITNIENAS